MTSQPGAGARGPDPSRCPDCGAILSNVDGVAACTRCGFTAAHPLAGRLWQIDSEMAGLGAERAGLIGQMRRDRVGTPLPVARIGTGPQAAPARSRRHVSAQTLLVALGAFLLIVAGIVFAAVTWDRLGAAGQAAVLAVATAVAVTTTLAAARAELMSTAEALSVVAAGFALIDVHAVRVVLAPDGDWQWVWAVGLVVVAAGLVGLGRAGSLRAPPIIGVVAVQMPLVVVASLSGTPGPAMASALLATATIDHLAHRRLRVVPQPALPDPVPALVGLLGSGAWSVAVLFAVPAAFGDAGLDVSAGERTWGIAVLAVATATAVGLAWSRPGRDRVGIVAAAAGVLVGLLTVLAVGRALTDDGDVLLLIANAAGFAVLAVSSAITARHPGRAPAGDTDLGVDPRVRGGQATAVVWTALTLLGWTEPVLGAIVAPFVEIADNGWWTRGFSVTTGALDLEAVNTPSLLDGPPIGLVLAAVALGTATVMAVVGAFVPAPGPRRVAMAVAAGTGTYTAVAVAGAHWSVAVAVMVAAYLAATAALALAPIRPGGRFLPGVAIAAIPTAATAVAWAGNVDVLTVLAFGFIALIGSAATAGGLVEGHRQWTIAATVVAGIAIPTTAMALALTSGATDQAAWTITVAVAAATTGLAWLADRWAPWWSPVVEVVGLLTTGGALAGLAAADGPNPFSVGLAVVVVVASAHVTRPTRRIPATAIAVTAALCLVWLQLWDADVRLVEAYSLPAAAAVGAAGWWQMRRDPNVGSWPTLGPALVIAAAPSALVAIVETEVVRPLTVLGIAVAMTIVGASRGLRAPLVVGSVTAVIMAVDQLFPVAARLPRWVGIGAAGVVLLVVGATFERQRRRVVDAYARYRSLR